MIEIVGNLLKTDIQYVAHQCNCISQKSAHLSKDVFKTFPYADVYSNRVEHDILGTIKVCGDGEDQRYVINMFGQYFPGKVKYPNGTKDNYNLRIKAFKSCLEEIEIISGLREVAFPYKIGCGAAGGIWEIYNEMLNNFAEKVFPCIDVYVLKLENGCVA